MCATLQSFLKIACVKLALAVAASSGVAADAVRAGFDRMLAAGPIPVSASAVPNGPADPLIAALVVPLRDGTSPARASRPADPALDSFVRMLAHEPNRATPAVPQGAGTDPLIAAMVWPLLRSKHTTVAGVAAPLRP